MTSTLIERKPLLFACTLLTLCGSSIQKDKRKKLQIGAIFPLSAEQGGWAGGEACQPAAAMALEDVNSQGELLQGYKLEMQDFDSQCQPGLGMKNMFDLITNGSTKLVLLAGCSLVTTVVAEAAPMWNLLVLSYGASSPALSNRERFPTLFRTHPSATFHNPTRVAMFERFKWRKIAIIQSVEEVFTSTAKDLERRCGEANIQVISRQSFHGEPRYAVSNLKRQDARIIVGLFYEKEARRVFCEVYQNGLYGRRYVWFLIGWYSDNWFIPPAEENLNCTAEQMTRAAQYHFTTEAQMLDQSDEPGVSGKTGPQFQEELKTKLSKPHNVTTGFVEAPLAYDAIWALALAFNCTMERLAPRNWLLEHFTYKNNSKMFNELYSCMNLTKFRGVSGLVMFSEAGDRIAVTQIEQLQDGQYILMGNYDRNRKRAKKLDWLSKEKFIGGKPPPDETLKKTTYLNVSTQLYAAVVCMSLFGIAVALFLMFFLWRHRFRKEILQSQPLCNGLMLVGFLICQLALVVVGLPVDGMEVSDSAFQRLCHARVSILMVGFSFAYGAMFAKVWLVHRFGISEHAELGKTGQQPIDPCRFTSVIGSLVAVDCIFSLVWYLVDPMRKTNMHFPPRESPAGSLEDVTFLPVLQRCESEKPEAWIESPAGSLEDVTFLPMLQRCESEKPEAWIGLVFCFKGVLILFGLFLAYESRNLKLRHVNDSRFVSLAIYNVSILSLITGPITTLLIRTQPSANFGFVAATVLLCTWISMGLVFLPKVMFVCRVPSNVSESSDAKGSTSERLSKEDQDRYTHLVAENRDIQRLIAEKEVRIAELRKRLEKRLAEESQSNQDSFCSANQSSTVVAGPQTNHLITTEAAVETRQNGESQGPAIPQADGELDKGPSGDFREIEDSGYKSSTNGGLGRDKEKDCPVMKFKSVENDIIL